MNTWYRRNTLVTPSGLCKDGQLLRIVDPLSNYLITEYKYYRPGEPDELEGFLHIKPEYRLPGELRQPVDWKKAAKSLGNYQKVPASSYLNT